MKFVMQFVDLSFGLFKRFLSRRSNAVKPSTSLGILRFGPNEAASLETVKEWIDCTGANFVSVTL